MFCNFLPFFSACSRPAYATNRSDLLGVDRYPNCGELGSTNYSAWILALTSTSRSRSTRDRDETRLRRSLISSHRADTFVQERERSIKDDDWRHIISTVLRHMTCDKQQYGPEQQSMCFGSRSVINKICVSNIFVPTTAIHCLPLWISSSATAEAIVSYFHLSSLSLDFVVICKY